MLQLEMSASDDKTQALKDQLQAEDDGLHRKINGRRRPRRAKDVNPNLVPLLRGEAAPDPLTSDDLHPPYGLEHTIPMLGIVVGVAMSIPLWGVLGLVARAMLR